MQRVTVSGKETSPVASAMSWSPLQSRSARLLQRKCACGGRPGPTGECEECRKKRQSLQGKTGNSDARLGHEFSRVPVHANSAKRPQTNSPRIRMLHQLLPEEGETKKYSSEGILMTLAGSGTCQNGGAASSCDPNNGAYKITANNNTCCTKDCSWRHEQTHVSDITSWGCCKALSVAYNKPGANKNDLVQKYNTWLAAAVDITECNAYSNDVVCANELAAQKDCTGAGRNTDCCKDIADYKTRYEASARTICARAPKQVPACPAF
jgi:hypothetical protein